MCDCTSPVNICHKQIKIKVSSWDLAETLYFQDFVVRQVTLCCSLCNHYSFKHPLSSVLKPMFRNTVLQKPGWELWEWSRILWGNRFRAVRHGHVSLPTADSENQRGGEDGAEEGETSLWVKYVKKNKTLAFVGYSLCLHVYLNAKKTTSHPWQLGCYSNNHTCTLVRTGFLPAAC